MARKRQNGDGRYAYVAFKRKPRSWFLVPVIVLESWQPQMGREAAQIISKTDPLRVPGL